MMYTVQSIFQDVILMLADNLFEECSNMQFSEYAYLGYALIYYIY